MMKTQLSIRADVNIYDDLVPGELYFVRLLKQFYTHINNAYFYASCGTHLCKIYANEPVMFLDYNPKSLQFFRILKMSQILKFSIPLEDYTWKLTWKLAIE